MIYRFDRAELRTRSRELLVNGVAVPLGGRAFDLLQVLIERRDRVVSARELFSLVWPGLAVQPNNLQVQVWALRALLGHHAIATVPRRGYRFTAAVDEAADSMAPPGPTWASGRRPASAAVDSGRAAAGAWPIETAAVCAELSTHRLVTLVGPDDAGRRGLAVAVARHLAPHLRGGHWFIDAQALAGIGDDQAHRQADRLAARLAHREALVVVFEGWHALPWLRRRLKERAVPSRMQILVTSREPLGLPGERVLSAPSRPGAPGSAAAPTDRLGLRWRGRPVTG